MITYFVRCFNRIRNGYLRWFVRCFNLLMSRYSCFHFPAHALWFFDGIIVIVIVKSTNYKDTFFTCIANTFSVLNIFILWIAKWYLMWLNNMCMMIYVGTILEWDCREVHDLKSKISRTEIVRISLALAVSGCQILGHTWLIKWKCTFSFSGLILIGRSSTWLWYLGSM